MRTVNIWDSAKNLSLPAEDYAFHRSGLLVPERLTRRPVAIDLFCGAGGMSLGFIQAGFEVIAALDYDYHCMITYLTNLGNYPCQIHWIDPADKERINVKMERDMKQAAKRNGGIAVQLVAGSGWISAHPEITGVSHFFFGDARKITGQEILDAIGLKPGEVDVVMGGPPCQGFSIAGKQDVMDPRNSFVFEFARLVLEIQPKALVMENVPGILSMVTPEGTPVVDALCRILSDGGFGKYEAIKRGLLASSGCGAVMKGTRTLSQRETARMEKGDWEEKQEQITLFEVAP